MDIRLDTILILYISVTFHVNCTKIKEGTISWNGKRVH